MLRTRAAPGPSLALGSVSRHSRRVPHPSARKLADPAPNAGASVSGMPPASCWTRPFAGASSMNQMSPRLLGFSTALPPVVDLCCRPLQWWPSFISTGGARAPAVPPVEECLPVAQRRRERCQMYLDVRLDDAVPSASMLWLRLQRLTTCGLEIALRRDPLQSLQRRLVPMDAQLSAETTSKRSCGHCALCARTLGAAHPALREYWRK